MKITIIAGIAENMALGLNGKIPWDCPGDMQHFRETTKGGFVIFGRKTYESLPRRPLPGRVNIVVSSTLSTAGDGSIWVNSLNAAIELCRARGAQTVFVCGGAMIYKQAFDIADSMILSMIPGRPKADVFFPEPDWSKWGLSRIQEMSGFNIKYYRKI